MEISKIFRFEASHLLPFHTGKCRRLHGHSWVLKVSVEGEINRGTGFVMDFGDLSDPVDVLIDRLDHRHLGAWPCGLEEIRSREWYVEGLPLGFNPTSENLLMWIGEQLTHVGWSKLELNETCTSSCILTREEYERTIGNVKGRMEPTK